jgi:probable HAF family extracellular repeat protein
LAVALIVQLFHFEGGFQHFPDFVYPRADSRSIKAEVCLYFGHYAVAGSVNERGEVIGISYTNSTPNLTTGLPTVAAFLWRRGKMIDLGNFGGNFTGSTQINNRGQVIGASNLPSDEFNHPFLWEDGKLIDLYTSSVVGNPYTVNAINEAGQLVGAGAFGDHPYDAYLWKKGVANDLGFLEGDCYSEAIVISSKGQIAGESYPCTLDSQRPFLWQDGTMYDLNDVTQAPSGFRFTQAFVINDRGEIGGIGTPPGCDFDEDCGHAMVLIPCNGRFHDPDCDQRSIFAVSGLATPQKQNATSVAGRGVPSRDLAAKIQAKFGRNRGSFIRKRK